MSATVAAAVPVTPVPAEPALSTHAKAELMLVRLTREIAMDIHPIEVILKNHKIDDAQWQIIQQSQRFRGLLATAVEEWSSALNTAERVKIKSLSCIEEALPEFFGKMHDPNENLPAKVKALEVFGNFAGLNAKLAQMGGNGGEKFSVTINLGADNQLKITAPARMSDSADQ